MQPTDIGGTPPPIKCTLLLHHNMYGKISILSPKPIYNLRNGFQSGLTRPLYIRKLS
ncbi:hypothetical protein Hanom_Chr17g01588441 [Helianthus anomalus]